MTWSACARSPPAVPAVRYSTWAAKRLYPALQVVAADVRALPFARGACAGTVAFYSLIYTADPTPALVELRRVVRPDGALLLAVHAGEGAQRFDSYKGLPIDLELHLRAPEGLAGQLHAARFTVERADVRPPDPFEHATRRLYVSGRATEGPPPSNADACSPTG